MNGYPVIVFVEGEFDCIVVCATTDLAKAWVKGAAYGAQKYAGRGFLAIPFSLQMARGPIGVAKVALDDEIYEEGFTIDRIEREKAIDALERAKTHAFPPLITVVK